MGAVQGLAAGEGSAWVSTAGATLADGLPQSCGPLYSGVSRPGCADRVGPPAPRTAGRRSTGHGGGDPVRAGAARLQGGGALGRLPLLRRLERPDRELRPPHLRGERQRIRTGGQARRRDRHLQLGLRTGGDPDPQSGARRSARDDQSREHLCRPHPARPATALGLPGEPDIYYPTGSRNYVRVLPPDDMHGAAHALLAKDLGLRRVYLLQDGSARQKGQLIDPFRYAARRLNVPIAGSAVYDPEDERFDELVDRVARSGADGIVLAADPYVGGDRLLKALRERLGTRVTIMAELRLRIRPRCPRPRRARRPRGLRDHVRLATRRARSGSRV